MNEKRFILDYDDEDCCCISNFLDNMEKLTDREVVDLLNQLNDENDMLKEVISENEKMLQNDLDMLTKLRRENKKKDIEIKSLNSQIKNWLDEAKIAKLYENEQYKTETLEKENKELRQHSRKQETQIRRLQNQINKLPPKIKEVWLE